MQVGRLWAQTQSAPYVIFLALTGSCPELEVRVAQQDMWDHTVKLHLLQYECAFEGVALIV